MNSEFINSLMLKEAYVDGGPVMKRFRAASMGRASRLRRPTSHLTVVIKSDDYILIKKSLDIDKMFTR